MKNLRIKTNTGTVHAAYESLSGSINSYCGGVGAQSRIKLSRHNSPLTETHDEITCKRCLKVQFKDGVII